MTLKTSKLEICTFSANSIKSFKTHFPLYVCIEEKRIEVKKCIFSTERKSGNISYIMKAVSSDTRQSTRRRIAPKGYPKFIQLDADTHD